MRIVGAGVLGAFGQWAFRKLWRVPGKTPANLNGAGHNALGQIKVLTSQIKAIDGRLAEVEGSVKQILEILQERADAARSGN